MRIHFSDFAAGVLILLVIGGAFGATMSPRASMVLAYRDLAAHTETCVRYLDYAVTERDALRIQARGREARDLLAPDMTLEQWREITEDLRRYTGGLMTAGPAYAPPPGAAGRASADGDGSPEPAVSPARRRPDA